MNPVRDWDEAYLLSLPVQEYDNIEFKAPQWLNVSDPGAKDKTCIELAKELAALANTGGGQLVLGIKDPQKCKSGVLEIVDGGVPTTMGKSDTAEWLRVIIPTLLDFPLTGFEVHPIGATDANSQILPGKALYVIDVPDSDVAPHQSKRDNKYYMRIGGNSVPVGHRLVLDILGRQKHPTLKIDFLIEGKFMEDSGRTVDRPRRRKFTLNITASNTGRVYSKYANVILYLPPSLVPNVDVWVEKQVLRDGVTLCRHHLDNTQRDIISGEGPHAARGSSWFDPILPGRSRTWQVLLDAKFPRITWQDELIQWEVFADNAPSICGEIAVQDIERTTEWSADGCPCCGAEEIAHRQWNCDCDSNYVWCAPLLCPDCGWCTGKHCRCGR